MEVPFPFIVHKNNKKKHKQKAPTESKGQGLALWKALPRPKVSKPSATSYYLSF